jgi:hypothetical protein
VIPFRLFFSKQTETQQLLQLFKLLRLPRLFQLIDPKQFTTLIKEYYNAKLKRIIKADEFKNEQLTDHNNIMR